MRNPNRIIPVLIALAQVWKMQPDLRLGQLILNAVNNEKVLYNIEDDDLINRIAEFYRITEIKEDKEK